LEIAFLIRIPLVYAFLPDVTQQIHSFRASGVVSSQVASAAGVAIRASRKSAGSLCTTPVAICFLDIRLWYIKLTAAPNFDWGLYDYRQKNKAAKDPAWAVAHNGDTELHGVCWFDWIPGSDKAKVLSLPSADSQNGKQSDYCK